MKVLRELASAARVSVQMRVDAATADWLRARCRSRGLPRALAEELLELLGAYAGAKVEINDTGDGTR